MSQAPRSGAVSVAVDPVALVITECITVTSAMRKHARWAHSSVSAILGGGASTGKLESRIRNTPVVRSSDEEKRAKNRSSKAHSSPEDVGLANRWGLRGKKGQSMQDNPLLSAFARLRSDLKNCHDIHNIDAPSLLHPFLQVIRSSSTSAPITSLALIAITKLFAYNIVSRESPCLPLGMQQLSSAVTHCRFEASDSATDEIVLFRILKLMEGMITGPAGDVIGDESMCEMMETGISMCCQIRLSELLRRSAEVSMVTMCQTIFERLKHLEVEEEEENPLTHHESLVADGDGVKMDPSIDGDILASKKESSDQPQGSGSVDVSRENVDLRESGNATDSSRTDLTQVKTNESNDIKPYSLPSIRELFRVLVDLLDPHERQHNDTMRVMALRIVDVALEVAGPSISCHPSLASLAKDTLCRHLFQLVRSENISILNESLRVAGTLLSTCRRVLKLQQELYISYLVACLHPRVEIPHEPGIDPALYDGVPQAPRLVKPASSQTSSGRSTPVPVKDRQRLGMEGGLRKPDAREAMVESVGTLVRIPSFMAELFVNYDCEVDRSDLCLDMVGLLARNAFPDAATWSTTNVPPLCLDALLGYVQSIADRLEDEPVYEGLPSREALQRQRDLKKLIVKGATRFNENPKAGLSFLASQNLIESVDDPSSTASFLKGTTRIDKKVLGDFISKKGNEKLLSAFLDLFEFSHLRVDEGLRQILNSFRLPGEAQLIERIVIEFTAKYCAKSPPANIANRDALYVLTYAIIMLNTDQHNPNVKSQNRMSFVDFSRNLRGVNDGKDFNQDYLQEIYDSIKTREIILPEEHDNRNAFDHAWKELLYKIQYTKNLTLCNTNSFDADMFAATWKPVVATLSYVFMSATDDTVFSRIVTGFDQCAQIAAKYDLHEALDHIVFCLSSISTLASERIPSTSLNTEVQAGDKSIMVSETAVRFGRDFKAQLATVVLFRLVVDNEYAIRNGWHDLVLVILNLFVNSLISQTYASTSSNPDLSSIPLQSPAQIIDRGERAGEGGIFSAFTSYVSSFANDEPPEPSDQEIEYTLCTVDCVSACSFEKFFQNIGVLPTPALRSFMRALLSRLPEDTSPKIMLVKPELPAPTPVRPTGQKPKHIELEYDPSSIFVLELATSLSVRDNSTLSQTGNDVAVALQSVVRDSSNCHPVTLSRAVYYLLRFLRASHDQDFVRAPVVLHTISKFEDEQLKQCAVLIVRGFSLCLTGPVGLRKEMFNSPDFWSVLQTLYSQPETAQSVFQIVEDVASGSASGLTVDNIDPVISILNDFATAGSIGAKIERRRDEAAARGKAQKPRNQQTSEPVARGIKAMQIVFQITSRIPSFIQQSHLEPQQAWRTYWSPPFRTLKTHSLNPCRQIRTQALNSLQRVLLSTALNNQTPLEPTLVADTNVITAPAPSNPATEITTIFTTILFPLLSQLLKPEVWHSDPAGMGETRLQAALLSCKVFLRFLDILLSPSNSTESPRPSEPATPITPRVANSSPKQQTDEKADRPQSQQQVSHPPQSPRPPRSPQPRHPQTGIAIWLRILETMERLIKSGGGGAHAEALEEAVPESIKNIVLVMANAGYLVPSATTAGEDSRTEMQREMWEASKTRMERLLPGLLRDVFGDDGAVRVTRRDLATDEKQGGGEAGEISQAKTVEGTA